MLTFIDTPGAYPGLGAEERGQAEAIGRSIEVMSGLRVPVICTVIGEGGSGGALAIGVANQVLMFEYATYSVITPEGCASILWRDGTRARRRPSSSGCWHTTQSAWGHRRSGPRAGRWGAPETRNRRRVAPRAPRHHLGELRGLSGEELVAQRYQRFRALGTWQ